MKLLYRTAFTQLLVAIPMVVLGTILGFFAVRHVVTNELDEQFEHYAEQLQVRLSAGQRLPDEQAPDRIVEVLPVVTRAVSFRDTIMYNVAEEEDIPWRIARFPVTLEDGIQATLQLGSATVEHEDLIMVLALVISGVLVLLLVVNIIVNRWLNQRLWAPFHHSLETMRSFRMDDSDTIELPSTPISEFSEMNATLNNMMSKVRKDFVTQKRFTEDAAHELQTPLAIMQGKLDQLIQSDALTEQDADTIAGIFQARDRMGKMVSNMLLMARIGNQPLPRSRIEWADLFKENLAAMKELTEERGIRVTLRHKRLCPLRIHPMLAQIIVSNLLRNAIQHNHPAGWISVNINDQGFAVSNSGNELDVEPETLFVRFAKGDPASSSTGLGLAMVKEICDTTGWDLAYSATAGTHTVRVTGEFQN